MTENLETTEVRINGNALARILFNSQFCNTCNSTDIVRQVDKSRKDIRYKCRACGAQSSDLIEISRVVSGFIYSGLCGDYQ
jgi:transposase-like protein